MPKTVDLTIEPNAKYDRVVGGYSADIDRQEPHHEWPEEHQEAADGYVEAIEDAPTEVADIADLEARDALRWEDIAPASDPDLIAKVATYFHGMEPDEPTERLRSKCRLLNVETYCNAQFAARQELGGV